MPRAVCRRPKRGGIARPSKKEAASEARAPRHAWNDSGVRRDKQAPRDASTNRQPRKVPARSRHVVGCVTFWIARLRNEEGFFGFVAARTENRSDERNAASKEIPHPLRMRTRRCASGEIDQHKARAAVPR